MTVAEIIQRIQSLYSKGVHSDDTRLSNRHIYNKIVSVRSRLISQEIKKKQGVSAWNYQTISCIEMIQVPSHQCKCVPPLGCDVLRSKHKLPAPLSGLNGHVISSVTSIDRMVKLDELKVNAVTYQKGNKYTKTKTTFFVQDDYIWIFTPSKIKYITMTALFEDPVKVKEFEQYCDNKDCKDCDCRDFLQEEFSIDMDLIDILIEMSLKELQIFGQSIEDKTNNTSDSLQQQSK